MARVDFDKTRAPSGSKRRLVALSDLCADFAGRMDVLGHVNYSSHELSAVALEDAIGMEAIRDISEPALMVMEQTGHSVRTNGAGANHVARFVLGYEVEMTLQPENQLLTRSVLPTPL